MNRPTFNAAWVAAQKIYDPMNTAEKVAKTIGGFVEININNPDAKQRWSNTCAVRMSYILNQAGVVIPKIKGQTVSGSDKYQYFFRVRDLISFLYSIWGKPDIISYPPSGKNSLSGKKGVILFEVSDWSDALGHATLFDGNICYDQCYFNYPDASYHTDRANFWELT